MVNLRELETHARAQYPPLIETNGMRNKSDIDESHQMNSSRSGYLHKTLLFYIVTDNSILSNIR